MISAPLPKNEAARQQSLDELQILDTLEEQAYDDLTLIAAQICHTPIALVSLIDRDRQWFKSHHGLDAHETPRELAFCAHAILDDHAFVVEDTLKDERFHDNPLVTSGPNVKFYAGAPLILRNNIRVGTLCVIDDHARPFSEKQRQALEALARQVVSQLELRLQMQALTRLDRTKDEFISMVNHELRTPLTSIYGSLALIRNQVTGEIPPQAMQLIDVAYRNGERLLTIVNDILDVAKLEAGKMEMQMGPVEVQPFLQKAIELNRPYCEAHGCNLELRPISIDSSIDSCSSAQVTGDENRLLQVMNNLISNAAKFTHASDTVEIFFLKQGDQVQVGVTDHGPGIPQEKMKDLFIKFNQLSKDSNAKAPGTGLGLNICKLIVEQHGGNIGCESVPGKHTTFQFTLPA
ncbi:MAG: GAF domain-containing sensor histidine kinase [Sulfuriferula multivorans]|uniref:histidine kinase n=1 Tax=Sulfuriferula multivorans TaxID=1559896 RepID=A0A7C9TAJ3_9PROT|nr:GAF domain-containing sensor histidine kinase [Sulfuriferula multivorans]